MKNILTTFKKMPAVIEITSMSKSTINNKINAGLFPPKISLGARSVAFVSNEIDEYMDALIQGKAEQEIKELIVYLVNQRNGDLT